MLKLLGFVATLSTLAAPALAQEGDQVRFTRDGISYVATISQKGGITTIKGFEERSRRSFLLRVSGNLVEGSYNGQPMTFAAPTSALRTASR